MRLCNHAIGVIIVIVIVFHLLHFLFDGVRRLRSQVSPSLSQEAGVKWE